MNIGSLGIEPDARQIMRFRLLEVAFSEKRCGQLRMRVDIVGVDLQGTLISGDCFITLPVLIEKRPVGVKKSGRLRIQPAGVLILGQRLPSPAETLEEISVARMEIGILR